MEETIRHIPIQHIAVRDRFRHDLGDLDSLAQDIERRGLLCPILLQCNGAETREELHAASRCAAGEKPSP